MLEEIVVVREHETMIIRHIGYRVYILSYRHYCHSYKV